VPIEREGWCLGGRGCEEGRRKEEEEKFCLCLLTDTFTEGCIATLALMLVAQWRVPVLTLFSVFLTLLQALSQRSYISLQRERGSARSVVSATRRSSAEEWKRRHAHGAGRRIESQLKYLAVAWTWQLQRLNMEEREEKSATARAEAAALQQMRRGRGGVKGSMAKAKQL